MSAITIRNLPDSAHDALGRIAAEGNLSVEALVRNLLADATQQLPAHVTGMADAGMKWGAAARASPPSSFGAR
jgi:plasmid stability protein